MHRHLISAFVLLAAACGGNGLDVTFGDDATIPDPNNSTSSNVSTNANVGSDMGQPDPDLGGGGTNNNATTADMGSVPDGGGGADMAMPAVCNPGDCGSGASCQNNLCTCDDGLFGDPLQGCSPANPCENVSCPAGSSCNPDGTCSCDPFFTGTAATACTPTPPAADLAARSNADVCAIWNDQYQRSAQGFWMIEPAEV